MCCNLIYRGGIRTQHAVREGLHRTSRNISRHHGGGIRILQGINIQENAQRVDRDSGNPPWVPVTPPTQFHAESPQHFKLGSRKLLISLGYAYQQIFPKPNTHRGSPHVLEPQDTGCPAEQNTRMEQKIGNNTRRLPSCMRAAEGK